MSSVEQRTEQSLPEPLGTVDYLRGLGIRVVIAHAAKAPTSKAFAHPDKSHHLTRSLVLPNGVTMTHVCCIDVGGTSYKVGVLDESGDLTSAHQVSTPAPRSTDGHEVLAAIVSAIEATRQTEVIDAVGVVVPGIVDEETGTAAWSENLGWRDVPFRTQIEDATGLPVAFGHDVRAGALAEARLGAARGFRDSVFLPIGTGIAAGLVIDGVPVSGGGWAGEVGHADAGHDEKCVCGLVGCLEAIASAGAVARRYAARTGQPVSQASVVAGRVPEGDPDAVTVWEDAVDGLGFALAQLACSISPEVVVIGGGLSRSGDQLLVPLRENLARRLSFQRVPQVVSAQLGDRAGCVGAGLMAFDVLG